MAAVLVAEGLVAAVLWGLAKERGRCLGKGDFSRSCLFTGPGGTRSCGSRPVGPAGRKERRSGARGSGENIPLRGCIKSHIARGLDDWGGDRDCNNHYFFLQVAGILTSKPTPITRATAKTFSVNV